MNPITVLCLCKYTTPWRESASELYRPSNRRLSAKLMPIFADRGCHMVSVTDPYCRIIGFLDRIRYFFFQVAPQLYSQRSVDPAPDSLLLRKYGSPGNRSRTFGSVARNSDLDHRGGHRIYVYFLIFCELTKCIDHHLA
jgi:hypothetical protein